MILKRQLDPANRRNLLNLNRFRAREPSPLGECLPRAEAIQVQNLVPLCAAQLPFLGLKKSRLEKKDLENDDRHKFF